MKLLRDVMRYIHGYLKIQICGISPERFLNACMYKGIRFWNIRPLTGAYELCIGISDFYKLKPILKRTGIRVSIRKRCGLPFFMFRHRKRRILFIGAVLAAAFVYGMSFFIWKIDITGNLQYSEDTLLRFLQESKVQPGMLAADADCSTIGASLREAYDGIIWVSVSLEGCRMKIQIRENEDVSFTETLGTAEPDGEVQDSEGSDLAAELDGVITSILVQKGIPLVKEGDCVTKGQILVSGAVPVKNDSGEVTGYQYQNAEAKIRAQTEVDYEDKESMFHMEKVYYPFQMKEPYLQAGRYRLHTGTGYGNGKQMEVVTLEKTIPYLKELGIPLIFGSRITHFYTTIPQKYEEKEIQKILSDNYTRFLQEQQKKGVEIIANDVKIYTEPKWAWAKGKLSVVTDIGTRQPISILEDKTDGDD